MRISLGLGITSPLCLRSARTPRSLFRSADAGFWFHPADTGSLAQDAAGSLAVTSVGQPVGRILDRSGRGQHATQASAGARPLHARMPVGGRRNMLVATPMSGWGAVKGGTGLPPVVNTVPATGMATLPDGAAGAAAGKGWTCTGLALDGSTLWWGNLGQDLVGNPVAQRQLIQTNLAGTAILGIVNIPEQPQGVAASGQHLYYAVPSLNQIRRVAKTGGEDSVFASMTFPNGLAADATGFWVSSNTLVHRVSLTGEVQGAFDTDLVVDHLHYDAARNWLWITSGPNGSAAVVNIWSLTEPRRLNTYRLSQALAVEGLVVSGNSLIVAHDGYYHGAEIADAARRFNEVQVYPAARILGGIWAGGLADHVAFDRGAGNTSADFSQMQQNSAVGGARVGSAYVWVGSGTGDIALNIADSSGNVQEVKTVTTTPSRVQTYRATSGTGEAMMLRLRGGVTTSAQLGLFVAHPQLEAGAGATAAQTVGSAADIAETDKPARFALLDDQVDDTLTTALPAGTYTVAQATDAGVAIATGVVHGGGAYTIPGPSRLYGAVAINRALTARETAMLTAWLNARRP